MRGHTARTLPAILSAIDLNGAKTVVDVGGGPGNLISACLDRFPGISAGILMDLPEVIAKFHMPSQYQGRLTTFGGSFFESKGLPKEADVYMLKHVSWRVHARPDCPGISNGRLARRSSTTGPMWTRSRS